MKLLRWRSDTIAKSLFFGRVAAIVFSSCCLVILITFFYDFKWQLLSDGSDIAKVRILSTLLRQRAMILATKIWKLKSDISNSSHRCRIERPNKAKNPEDSNIWCWKSR
jgi:hypothetical protein